MLYLGVVVSCLVYGLIWYRSISLICGLDVHTVEAAMMFPSALDIHKATQIDVLFLISVAVVVVLVLVLLRKHSA